MGAAAVSQAVLAAITLFILGYATDATYIESVAANVDSKSASSNVERRHEAFVPLVAFQCGYRNKFMNKDGEWQDDPSSAASCLQGKYDILKYCKRVYPNEEISNIVEYSHLSRVDKWCKEDGTGSCKHHFTVRPYRCIVGEFVTESLQVPSQCRFSHVAGRNKCNDFKYWNMKAESACGLKMEEGTSQSMKLRSFAVLEPCGLGMFRGVEYVCCPKSVEEDSKDHESTTEKEEQDPYFKDDSNANEHDRFRDAEERLEKKHRKKVTKVITEWSELFERYNKMKEKDPKGAEEYKREMTAKFRKTVAALEEENKEQRTQIEEVHDERIQSALNEKKRQATHDYRAALAVQVGNSNKNNVLRTLKNYIKAEEKDRSHMLNRYRHLLRSDPEQAISFEPVLLHRLRYIDLRINGTLAMLRDFPELEKQVRPQAVEYWKDYRHENTPDITGGDDSLLGGEEKNERLIRLYKQTYEHNHPGVQLAFENLHVVEEKKPTTVAEKTTKTTTPSPTIHHVVALKDVLAEKNDEDSDEDQFDDDEESDSSSISDSMKKSSTETKKFEVNGKAKPVKIPTDSKKKMEKPAKFLSRGESDSIEKKKKETEDENADDDEDDETFEDGEYSESNDKKESSTKSKENDILRDRELSVAIEPIVSAAGKLHEALEDSPPAYARHDLLVADNAEFYREQSYIPNWSNANFAIGLIACAFLVVLVVAMMVRRRTKHPGFIEVDVCTPEDRHVANMQVNGYENPTYSFFDSKA
ncbi:e2 domain of amyloid precursor protein [Ditylenchus destructor]|nr:e2 domain of amyloid precursor protein [Ditylenchus destructor]